jgi:hypothetical protein
VLADGQVRWSQAEWKVRPWHRRVDGPEPSYLKYYVKDQQEEIIEGRKVVITCIYEIDPRTLAIETVYMKSRGAVFRVEERDQTPDYRGQVIVYEGDLRVLPRPYVFDASELARFAVMFVFYELAVEDDLTDSSNNNECRAIWWLERLLPNMHNRGGTMIHLSYHMVIAELLCQIAALYSYYREEGARRSCAGDDLAVLAITIGLFTGHIPTTWMYAVHGMEALSPIGPLIGLLFCENTQTVR